MRSPAAASACALVACILAIPRVVSARPIETATFPVGPSGFVAVQGVAAGLDGTLVFVYADDGAQTFTQWTSATGAALAPALRITGGLVGARRQTADGFGGSIVAYARSIVADDTDHLFARRLDGTGVPVGPEFRVDTASDEVGPFSFDVAALPTGFVFTWHQDDEFRMRLFDRDGLPRGDPLGIDHETSPFVIPVAGRSDGGFALTWLVNTPVQRMRVATFEADGSPRSPVVDLPRILQQAAIAGGAAGSFAVAGTSNPVGGRELVVRRYDADAQFLGETVVEPIDEETSARPTLAADTAGNWHLVWGGSRFSSDLGLFVRLPPRARPIAADGTPLEPTFALSDRPTHIVATSRLPNGSFVNAWASPEPLAGLNEQRSFADVTSLCTPDIRALCGDGAHDGRCEECDDGAANDDAAPTRAVRPVSCPAAATARRIPAKRATTATSRAATGAASSVRSRSASGAATARSCPGAPSGATTATRLPATAARQRASSSACRAAAAPRPIAPPSGW